MSAQANPDQRPSAADDFLKRYEEAEGEAAKAAEEMVSTRGFAKLLAQTAENTVVVSRATSDLLDLLIRRLRIAGRSDITELARQLARTEDKLERVLQEIERLQDQQDAAGAGAPAAARPAAARSRRKAPGGSGRA